MTVPSVRQLCVVCLLWCLGCWSASDASPYGEWDDGLQIRQVRDLQNPDLNDYLWRDQNEEQVQNVFKRFLFHYSKARNSLGALQQETQSVHPLMRLSPKLSQRKKKVLLLDVWFLCQVSYFLLLVFVIMIDKTPLSQIPIRELPEEVF